MKGARAGVLFPPVSAEPDSEIVDAIACPHCAAVRDIGLWDLGTNVVCAACDEPFGVPKTRGGVPAVIPWPTVSYASGPRTVAKTGSGGWSLNDYLGYLDLDLFLRVVRWIGGFVIVCLGLAAEGGIALCFIGISLYGGGPGLWVIVPVGLAAVPVALSCYGLYLVLSFFLYMIGQWAEHGIGRRPDG